MNERREKFCQETVQSKTQRQALNDKLIFINNELFKIKACREIENSTELIINCFTIISGNYSRISKKSCLLILKMLIPQKYIDAVLSDDTVSVVNRRDKRVCQWIKNVKSVGQCEYCGNTENLQAHHIIPWAEYPGGRIDIENGICLCAECHADEHTPSAANLILSHVK